MAKLSFRQELEKRAGRTILIRSLYRWESAAIIGLTLVLTLLAPRPFPFWEPWFWVILGTIGEIALVWASITDPEFRAKAVADMFREKFEPKTIKNKALAQRVGKALEYRDRIDAVIHTSREGVLRDHLRDVSQGAADWMESIFRLAQRLDAYEADAMIHQDLQSLPAAIEDLKKRLVLEDSDAVKRQISQTIAQKQIQMDNLSKLQNVMERAQFQLESTITAMGTVYSQVMILDARDVGSGRAERLQQDIAEQVTALQDVVHTVDEVYQTGVEPLGSVIGADPLAAATTLAQPSQKRTSGN